MPSFKFKNISCPKDIPCKDWENWKWQLRQLKNSFPNSQQLPFAVGTTPYYIKVTKSSCSNIKKIIQPDKKETLHGLQSIKDPLGEKRHSPTPHVIHRYPDRIIFLVTDTCAVYCRYCTRKRYTGKKQSLVSKDDYQKSLSYIKANKGIREVILSGGDPLTLSDTILNTILNDLRSIDHVEIIRLASRVPVVCPMRFTTSLINVLKKYQPVFLITHFNHPDEITKQVVEALTLIADSGILIFNQTVLLNGVNNHPALIQALMRRLLYLRVKPYYMFQCDPSEGSDHFRTSVENSQWIQRELWGRLSGLALPQLSLDIPNGGGKVGIVPNFLKSQSEEASVYKGWDGIQDTYKNPPAQTIETAKGFESYEKEWLDLKNQSYGLPVKKSA